MSDSLYYRTADIESLLADRPVQQLLELLDEHPDWSVQEFADHLTLLANGQQVLTQQQVKTILIRLHIYTPSQRGMLTTMVEDWWDNDNGRKRIFESYPSLVPLIQYKRACLEKQDKPPAKVSSHTHSGTDYERVDLTTLLSDRAVQQLLELAEQHPGWSIADILSIQRHDKLSQHILTYQQARTILRRLHMETISQRRLRLAEMGEWEQSGSRSHNLLKKTLPDLLRYLTSRRKYQAWLAEDFWKKEQKQARTINSTEQASQSYQPQAPIQTHHASPVATTHIPHTSVRMPAPVFPPPPQPQQPPVVVPQFSFTPTQQETFKTFDRFFFLAKQFSLVAIISFLFFFTGSLVFDSLFHARGLLERIGMFFSFAALSCGLLFFLYSLKYYLTIAVILSFSRSTRETGTEPSGWRGFLSRLFGISIEIEGELAKAPASLKKPGVSLEYDLSTIQLERHPFVSVQVATYNEKRVIDRFLLAATAIEYDNFEIVVADDSTDETVQLLEQWKSHPKVRVSHRTTREGFKGGALKQALNLTDQRAEYILVFDADFIPYPDTIIQFLKYFQQSAGTLSLREEHDSARRSNPVASSTSSRTAAVQGYQLCMII